MLSVGSLFSGIGGFDLGLERAGMRVLWQCEQDPFCQRVLAHHWPHIPCFEDVCDLRGHDVPGVDVLCGGFPCQDISLAGKGVGIEGARSGLWSEYARLIDEIRPRYVIVENVAALLARGLDRVLADLAALGYDAEWDCIPASAVGAPHRRDRLWLVAYPQPGLVWQQQARLAGCDLATVPGNDGSAQLVADAEVIALRPGLREDEPGGQRWGRPGNGGSSNDVGDPEGNGRRQGWSWGSDSAGAREREPERALQDADERALESWRVGGRAAQAGGPEWWAVEPPVGRVAHGVPDQLDQLAALGNALVPQIAEWIGRRIIEWELSR